MERLSPSQWCSGASNQELIPAMFGVLYTVGDQNRVDSYKASTLTPRLVLWSSRRCDVTGEMLLIRFRSGKENATGSLPS